MTAIELGPFTAADYEPLSPRRPIFDPPSSNNGYQVESWIDKQLSKGAVLRDRDGNPIRVRDGMLLRPITGGSFITGTSTELIYASTAAGTAKASFTTEFASLNDTPGMGNLAHVPVDFWTPANLPGKTLRIEAMGILSSTATPTYTFTTRLGAAGSTTAAIVAGTAALTTASGAANAIWRAVANITLTTVGAAGANSTVRGLGLLDAGSNGITTNAGLNLYNASASATAPTVATVDVNIVNFINFNIACSASSASNTIQLLQLLVFGLN